MTDGRLAALTASTVTTACQNEIVELVLAHLSFERAFIREMVQKHSSATRSCELNPICGATPLGG